MARVTVSEMMGTPSGKAMMLLFHMISAKGRQGIKDLCMASVEEQECRDLLDAINTYERGLSQLHRMKERP